MIDHTLSSLLQFSTIYFHLLQHTTTYFHLLQHTTPMITPYNYDMLRPRRNLSPDSVTHMFELTNNAHNAHIEQRIRERGA